MAPVSAMASSAGYGGVVFVVIGWAGDTMSMYTPYFHKYKWPFLVAVLCVACEAPCDLLGPTLMARAATDARKGRYHAMVVSQMGVA